MDAAGRTNNEHIVNHIYVHIDSHMPLFVSLRGYTECSDALYRRLLAIDRPEIEKAFTAEHIPDISALLPMGVTYNHTQMSNKREAKRKFPTLNDDNLAIVIEIIHMINKLLGHRCHIRAMHTLWDNSCETNRSMCEFVLKIIIASLLGVYSWSKKLGVNQRARVYELFARPVPYESLKKMFNEGNTTTLLYIAKEHFFEMASRLPGFLAGLPAYNWDVYRQYVVMIGNVIRENIENNMQAGLSDLDSMLTGVEERISDMHVEYRPHQHSNSLNYNMRALLNMFHDINFKNYPVDPDTVRPGFEYLAPDPNQQMSDDETGYRKETMRLCIRSFLLPWNRKQHVPMDWLVCFGLSVSSIRKLQSAVFGGPPRLESALLDLRRRDSEGYAIFYTFCLLVKSEMDYYECTGDFGMYTAHMKSLREFHGIQEGDIVPEVSGSVLVCNNCGDIKRPSFFQHKFKNKNNNNGKCMLLGDGTAVCARRPKIADWRIRYREEFDEAAPSKMTERITNPTAETVTRKFAKYVSRQIMLHRCNNQPLRLVNALGRVAVVDGIPHLACFSCLHVCPVEDLKYIGEHIICDSCNTSVAIHTVNEDSRCLYCNNKTISANRRSFLLYDDDAPIGQQTFKIMHICNLHHPLQWIYTYNIYKKSVVWQGIDQKWDTKNANGVWIAPLSNF
jgi:hypothetical protein